MNRLTNVVVRTGMTASIGVAANLGGTTAHAETVPQRIELVTQQPGQNIGIHAVRNHVNLGDSFASGFGGDTVPYAPTDITKYDGRTVIEDINECYRLRDNYGALVAVALNKPYIDASCAGAKTDDILKSQWPDRPDEQPPQIESVTKDTDLITIQVGGNTVLFEDFVKAVVGDPLNPRDPTNQLTENSPVYIEAMRIMKEVLPGKLDEVYAAIKERAANDATVLVNLYDNILPEHTESPEGLPLNLCSPYMLEDELRLSNIFVNGLNDTIRAAAGRAGEQFKLVEPTKWSERRDAAGLPLDACSISADAKAWSIRFEEPDPNSTNLSFHGTATWHPAQAAKNLKTLSN